MSQFAWTLDRVTSAIQLTVRAAAGEKKEGSLINAQNLLNAKLHKLASKNDPFPLIKIKIYTM